MGEVGTVPWDHPDAGLRSWKSFRAQLRHIELQLEMCSQPPPSQLLVPQGAGTLVLPHHPVSPSWSSPTGRAASGRSLVLQDFGSQPGRLLSPSLRAGSVPGCSCWRRESSQPSSQEPALEGFCQIKQFVFMPLSGWRPGLHAHQPLAPEESLGCARHVLPRSELQQANIYLGAALPSG